MTLAEKVTEFPELSDWEVADRLNAPDKANAPVRQSLDVRYVQSILMTNTDWAALVMGAEVGAREETRADCVLLRDILALRLRVEEGALLDATVAVLERLIGAGVLRGENKVLLESISARYPSWAEEQGLPPVTARAVGLARGGKGGEGAVRGASTGILEAPHVGR